MSILLICSFFILSVFGGYSPPNPTSPPLPCPTPEDRDNAYYTNGTCSGRYSCCFNEPVIDPISGNSSNMSCCYAYGADGPYKCCGRTNDHSELIFLLFALPPLPFVFLLFYCCYKAFKTDDRQLSISTKSINSIPQPINPDPTIELETIVVESCNLTDQSLVKNAGSSGSNSGVELEE